MQVAGDDVAAVNVSCSGSPERHTATGITDCIQASDIGANIVSGNRVIDGRRTQNLDAIMIVAGDDIASTRSRASDLVSAGSTIDVDPSLA